MSDTPNTFSDFCDAFLVACADTQVGKVTKPIDVQALCDERFPNVPPTWVQNLVTTLVRTGVGADWSTLKERTFMINGHGLIMAEKIRAASIEQTIVRRIASIPRADWINLGSLLMSAGALIVAILAYLKA